MSYKKAIHQAYLEKIASDSFDKEAAVGKALMTVGKQVLKSKGGRNIMTGAVLGGIGGGAKEMMTAKEDRKGLASSVGKGALFGGVLGGATSAMAGNKFGLGKGSKPPAPVANLTGKAPISLPGKAPLRLGYTPSVTPSVTPSAPTTDRSTRGFGERIQTAAAKSGKNIQDFAGNPGRRSTY